MADEALKCFSSLLESIPGWIADLESILKQSAERQKQILFENQPAQDDPPIDSCQQLPRKTSKTASVRSNRSQAAHADVDKAKVMDSEPSAALVQAPHMTLSDALRWAQRKRKTASAESGAEDRPHKYRSKSMVVIYYDGDTQKRFEEMVRGIGTTRNKLRKGKMNAKLDLMTGSSMKDAENDDSDGSSFMPTIAVRSTRTKPVSDNRDETLAFDQVDGLLEKAQSMCERAAHQVLRDGDCALEIRHAKVHFADAKVLGETEMPKWQTRAEEAAERDRQSEERAKAILVAEEIDQTSSSSSEELASKRNSSSPASVELAIEPDDSDGGDDVELVPNILQYRRSCSKKPYVRSTGLRAH